MTPKKRIILICILLTVAVVRIFLVFGKQTGVEIEDYGGRIVKVTGVIVTEPQIKDFNQMFIFESQTIDDREEVVRIRVTTDRYLHYDYGQRLILEGKLITPRNFESNGGRTFDYINFLLKDGIYFEMKKPTVTELSGNEGSFASRNLFKLKQGFLRNIKAVLGEPHAALAGGLVVGEKSALGKDLIDDFRRSGLIHIVVLSGYNITIVADSIRRMLSFLPRTLGIILGGLGIIAFGMLVGGGATVVRSCIMASIALLGTLVRKDYNVKNALFLAGICMVIQNPLILLYDPSFQLSFLATLGLIILSPVVEKRCIWLTERFGIRGLVASTLATQIFVSPYILYMMGQLSIIGIVVNILVLPIIPLTMLFVFLTGALGFVSHFVSEIAGWVSHILLSYELFMVQFFAKLPFASLEVPKFSFWIVVAFYASYTVALSKFPEMTSQLRLKKKSST
ncbi:MAG: ComEC/Rec2 family competence protein [Patescibacteria group bacterium]